MQVYLIALLALWFNYGFVCPWIAIVSFAGVTISPVSYLAVLNIVASARPSAVLHSNNLRWIELLMAFPGAFPSRFRFLRSPFASALSIPRSSSLRHQVSFSILFQIFIKSKHILSSIFWTCSLLNRTIADSLCNSRLPSAYSQGIALPILRTFMEKKYP